LGPAALAEGDTLTDARFDVAAVRDDFPAAERILYLDTAHQAPLARSVRDALLRFYEEGLYAGGPKPMWLDRVEEVRGRVARFINADPDEIAFTKNTSEGLNIAANAIPFRPGDNVLMVHGDHPNNAYAFLNLRRKGVDVRFIPLESETADATTFLPHIDDRTRAISISHVTFHAGHRFALEGIGRLCAEHRLYFVVDAMQSIGVLPVDAQAFGASFMAAGSHKGLLVPQGLGLLYVRRGQPELEPAYLAMAGLEHPPADYVARADNITLRDGARRFEIGNYNLPAVHALAASLDILERVGPAAISDHVLSLGDRLLARLASADIEVVGPRSRNARSHIYTLTLRDPAWLDYLNRHNVRISPERDGIRVSFALFNTEGDVDRLCDLLRSSALRVTS
jgi:cysteine desulfurase / selenocysteine lyase